MKQVENETSQTLFFLAPTNYLTTNQKKIFQLN